MLSKIPFPFQCVKGLYKKSAVAYFTDIIDKRRLSRSFSVRSIGRSMKPMNVTICGGGNAAHVLCSYIGAIPEITTNMLNILDYEFDHVKNVYEKSDHVITAIHRDGRPIVHGKLDAVTDHASTVIPASDVIIIAVPAFVHEIYLRKIEHYLTTGTIVGVMVGQGGADWTAKHVLGPEKFQTCTFFAMETLPWACRVQDFALSVEVMGTKKIVDIAVHPVAKTQEICDLMTWLIGNPELSKITNSSETVSVPAPGIATSSVEGSLIPFFYPNANMLNLTLMNINSVWHPCITYGRFKDWDGKTPFVENPLFYEGVDAFTAQVLTEVSNEVLLVRDAITQRFPRLDLSRVRHVKEWMLSAYGDDIADKSSLQAAINTNLGYQGLRHAMVRTATGGFVPDTQHRYWVEDLPLGLAVTRGVAELAEVKTPRMDEVIRWMQKVSGMEYLANDGSMTGVDLKLTHCPQRFGLRTLEDLCALY